MYFFFLFFSHAEKTTELNLVSTCCENAIAISSWKQKKATARQGTLRRSQILSSGTDFQQSHMAQIDPICIRLWTFPTQISTDVALYKLIPPSLVLKCWCCADILFHGHPDTSCILLSPGSLSLAQNLKIWTYLKLNNFPSTAHIPYCTQECTFPFSHFLCTTILGLPTLTMY